MTIAMKGKDAVGLRPNPPASWSTGKAGANVIGRSIGEAGDPAGPGFKVRVGKPVPVPVPERRHLAGHSRRRHQGLRRRSGRHPPRRRQASRHPTAGPHQAATVAGTRWRQQRVAGTAAPGAASGQAGPGTAPSGVRAAHLSGDPAAVRLPGHLRLDRLHHPAHRRHPARPARGRTPATSSATMPRPRRRSAAGAGTSSSTASSARSRGRRLGAPAPSKAVAASRRFLASRPSTASTSSSVSSRAVSPATSCERTAVSAIRRVAERTSSRERIACGEVGLQAVLQVVSVTWPPSPHPPVAATTGLPGVAPPDRA